MTTVCEVGPSTIRLLDPGTTCPTPPDDTTAEGWRAVLEPLLAGAGDVLLVHPSWWTPGKVAMVTDAVRGAAATVRAVARAALLHPDQTFVEIGPEFVAIGDGHGITGAETRCAEVDVVIDRVVGRLADGLVHIDAPTGVPGADALGARLARRLRVEGRRARVLTDRHLRLAARDAPRPAPPPPRHPGRWVRILAATVAVAVVGGVALTRENSTATTDLVDGRVTMRVPADWTVRRVTDGPGSARVEITAPDDPGAALYLTQSPVPDPDPAVTATALRAALEAEPPGVFVEFTTGADAVTYREIRPGREIDWTVLLSGHTRIAIGCWRASSACARAIESAHETG